LFESEEVAAGRRPEKRSTPATMIVMESSGRAGLVKSALRVNVEE
jgi:hypothetical protein